MKTINIELVKTALEKVDGTPFEHFANAAFAELLGPDFVPLGGPKDWGADAVLSSARSAKRPDVFFQSSIEENARNKIRKTVGRLREVKRTVNTLYYATSRIVQKLDILEAELGDELGVIIRIRDGSYFATHINSSPGMLAAYQTYLAPAIAFLRDLHASPFLANDTANVNSAVYVFLRNELDARETGGSAEGLTDGLIIWALRDTDSNAGKFMTERQIIDQIEKDVTGSTDVLKGMIPVRLVALSRISQTEQRPVRHHASENKFCIAYDLREKMQNENLQAEALRRQVFADYRVRILAHNPKLEEKDIKLVSNISLRAIQKCLENEGIEFAAFLQGGSQEAIPLLKSIEECLLEENVSLAKFDNIRDLVQVVLHAALTKPSTQERAFYSRIASVYTILFCLRTEPRLIQYFEQMAGRFRFYVGADVLVQALAERFLPDESKVFANTLSLVTSAGGALVLTEPVLEEVQHHLHAADQEFKNHYQDAEEAIADDNVEIINRPLIRAYFRGKFSGKGNRPRNWQQFINNYCDPRMINTERGKEELRKYLMAELKLSFETRKEIEAICRPAEVEKLTKCLIPHKKRRELAWNDALMAHSIFARRAQAKEGDDVSGYGLRTWWLTNEYSITSHTKDMVEAEGASYLMRPDFLLNFLSFLPKKRQAKAIFDTLFPTLLGVHLARDHSPDHVKRLHEYLREIKTVEPARRSIIVGQQSDRLKADLRTATWSEFYNARKPQTKT